MNEEQRTTMDNQTGRMLSGAQLVEKVNLVCDEVASGVHRIQTILDRPLNMFAKEDIREMVEHLQTTLDVLLSLPAETMQEHIPSYDVLLRGLQKTLIELTLAGDQFSPLEKKASFYTHLLVSQGYFAGICVHDLLEANERVYVHTDPAPVTLLNFSIKPRPLLDFSQTLLPGMYTLIQTPGAATSIEYEQAIAHVQTLDEILEKQKSMLKGSLYIDNNEYTILRCQLSVLLPYASELLRRLIHSLSTLQSQSRSKSRRTAQLRQETRFSLDLLIHTIDDLCQKIQDLNLLLHQERFQHKKTELAL